MRLRHPIAALIIATMSAAPATASVLSASGHAVGTKSSKADYLRVTTVQDELNLTVQEMNEDATSVGDLSTPAPNVAEGGYILQRDGEGGGLSHGDGAPSAVQGSDGREGGRMSLPGGTVRGSNPGSHDVQGGNYHRGNRGGGRRGGGGPHATPEPSTWMLLGAGLLLFGGYATLRRREQLDH